MYECETCTAAFWYQDECEDHMNYYDHWPACETCTATFRTQHACDQHMRDKNHRAARFKCETCTKTFLSQDAANQHMKDLAHYKNYCKGCDRRFRNENDLRVHLNSKTHRGVHTPCPFCKDKYSASGLAHHLEMGSCPRAPGFNRETVLRIVRQRDPHGVITNKQIGWHMEEDVKYSATNRAFNGSFWECYICHKGFKTDNALNAHLNSPTHKQTVYHCPNSRGNCGKQFVLLGALLNHLESEACAFMRFKKVQQQVGHVFEGQKLIAFS